MNSKEMREKLEQVSDSYEGFVAAVVTYTKKNDQRFKCVNTFMEQHPKALSSDILEFISEQDDFYDDAAYENGAEGLLAWDGKMSEQLQIRITSTPDVDNID